jgi:hypothetical protein
MDGPWKDTRLGELAAAIHSRMNVQGLVLAVGKDEARANAGPARIIFSAPDGEDLEAPAQHGGEGQHICEDRVIGTNVALWGRTAGDAERLYERFILAIRALGISRRARQFGRVRWEEGAGRAGSAGVKVIVPLVVRIPIVSVDLKKALVLETSVEVAAVDPSGNQPEGF